MVCEARPATAMLTFVRGIADKLIVIRCLSSKKLSICGLRLWNNRCRNAVCAHVWAEGFRDKDGAILLLIVVHDSDPGTADGEARAVQGVYKFTFAAGSGLETYAGAARLKGFAIRTRGDFAKLVGGRQPDFQVIGFCGGEAHVTGA